jgi:3-oxoacyl-[acyl-carrier protein] reductase
MSKDESIASFSTYLTSNGIELDGAVMMPTQIPPTNECLPESSTWREIFQNSFIGPLALLKTAIGSMRPDPANGRRAKIVIISGISSAQVLGHYATCRISTIMYHPISSMMYQAISWSMYHPISEGLYQ